MYQCPKCGEYADNIFEHYADCKGYHILVSKRYEYKFVVSMGMNSMI